MKSSWWSSIPSGDQASGDMNDILRSPVRGASDAVKLLSESAVEGQYPDRPRPAETMAQDKQVPDRAALALPPATLLQEIRESGRVAQFNGKVLDAQGVASEQTLTRDRQLRPAGRCWFLATGAEGLESGAGPARQRAFRCGRLSGQEGEALPLDPSHGVLLDMLAQAPTFWQQVQQGGCGRRHHRAAGRYRPGDRWSTAGASLANWVKVRRQLKSGEYHADNALGRC